MSLLRSRLSHLARSRVRLRTSLASRTLPAASFTSSAPHRNATPDWEQLVGGRAGIERKRQQFEEKYRAALEAKAKAEGISVDELKERVRTSNVMAARPETTKSAGQESLGPVEAGSMDPRKSEEELKQPEVVKPLPSAEEQGGAKAGQPPKQGDSPVKPLNDIMDLSKASDLTTPALSQLWTAYHQSKGFLSAAVPMETYLRMINSARKYPLFVLPLARVAELPEGQEDASATEMHLLEWSLLPQPAGVNEPVPPPSTVLFTPLAEYKARQEYAQPYLILTHYTDLANSHNVVLMRGEITPNVALNSTDAQVLAVRMQLFYNDTGKGGDIEQARRELLRTFHEAPEEFNVEALIKAGSISELSP
ncbi:Protein ATP11, mitochondrial [Rhodotorula toruloides]|uniref:ATP11 protein-domain containing protein n=1 Tax=Rhodotorula toruloides TaxID=5286 RepID=A0A0K3CBW1_RHOTO|nr:Protein ATP11, mitochondrial [Rhodotorula toruloides]PRQ76230.1 ATP11 protein-domain containing protein [Rhodotorula toruloides]